MTRFSTPILVTRPYLPDLTEFKSGIDEIWHNQWLTNNGPLLQRFQSALATYLNVPETNLALFNNGTLALELGFQALGLAGGDVITTPFTFVATSHALKRIGATPVFADIDPETLCLDPAKVEPLITSRTKAIVPVHVYGNVCDIEAFDRLSQKYNIPVIYDAAHAFGVFQNAGRCRDTQNFAKSDVPTTLRNTEATARSAFREDPSHPNTTSTDSSRAVGDEVAVVGTPNRSKSACAEGTCVQKTTIGACGAMSMFSFHPTKLFHSCEGGLLVFKDSTSSTFLHGQKNLQEKLFELRNFAIHSETECTDVGSNAKMNELQALMGLCCLKHMPELLAYRQSIYNAYAEVFNAAGEEGDAERQSHERSADGPAVGSEVVDGEDARAKGCGEYSVTHQDCATVMPCTDTRLQPQTLHELRDPEEGHQAEDHVATLSRRFGRADSQRPRSVRLLPYSANHAYVPVLFDSPATREKVYTELKEKCNVFSRRYFYPLLTDFAPYIYARNTCPIAQDIASRVLTLPTYYGLPLDDVKDIARNVLEIVNS